MNVIPVPSTLSLPSRIESSGEAKRTDSDPLDHEYKRDVIRHAWKRFAELKIDKKEIETWGSKYHIIFPWSKTYNDLRINFNRLVQPFPLMIFMVRHRKCVMFALELARKYKLPFSIRSGGHDALGYSTCPGIIIDVSKRCKIKIRGPKRQVQNKHTGSGVKSIKVHEVNHSITSDSKKCDGKDYCVAPAEIENPIEWKDLTTVKIGAGCRIGPVIKKLYEAGYMLGAGTCPNVALVGLSCGGGGFGFLHRKLGLTSDAIVEVNLIDAAGKPVKANNKENTDLFWALKGSGSGNYGVITDLKLKVVPACDCILFEVWFPFEALESVLRLFQDWAPYTNNNLTAKLGLFSPDNRPGSVLLYGQYVGKRRSFPEMFHLFKDIPHQAKVWRSKFIDSVRYTAPVYPAWFFTEASAFVETKFDAEAIAILKEYMTKAVAGQAISIFALGGKVAQPDGGEMESGCFPWRNCKMWMYMKSAYNDLADQGPMAKWVYNLFRELSPSLVNPNTGVPRGYNNFKVPLHVIPRAKVGLFMFGENYDKLQEIKRKYDPHNVFKFPQSIEP